MEETRDVKCFETEMAGDRLQYYSPVNGDNLKAVLFSFHNGQKYELLLITAASCATNKGPAP